MSISNNTNDLNKVQSMMALQVFSQMIKKSMGNSPAFDMVMESVNKALMDKTGTASNINLFENNLSSNLPGKLLNNNAKLKGTVINTTSKSTKISGNNTASSFKSNNERIESAILNASKRYGVDSSVIRAIIKQESDFDPNITSWAGAMGLMQLMPENVEHYGISDPYNIEQNIDAGTRHIKDYIKLYNGDVKMGLAAYNAGPGTLQRRGVKSEADFYKLPSETKNYVKIISKNLGI